MHKHRLFMVLVILILLFRCLSICTASTIRELYLKSKGGEYSQPGTEELQKARMLFNHAFKREIDDSIREQWSDLGFNVIEVDHEEQRFIIIAEQKNTKKGRGFYVFNHSLQGNIAMQIPHRFKDMYTGMIGFEMMVEGEFISCAWNTVPRTSRDRKTRMDADMAHLGHSYFTAYTKSFIDNYSGGYTVQLHGFSKSKRRDGIYTRYEVILSSGNGVPSSSILELDSCMDTYLSDTVRVYPLDVKELGATTNTIGAIIRKRGLNNFIHIEMSKPVRLKLLDNRELRSDIIQCIIRSIK